MKLKNQKLCPENKMLFKTEIYRFITLFNNDLITMVEQCSRVMNWKEHGRTKSRYNLRYYPHIYLTVLRKTLKNLSQEADLRG
jgi:hypothetical protein